MQFDVSRGFDIHGSSALKLSFRKKKKRKKKKEERAELGRAWLSKREFNTQRTRAKGMSVLNLERVEALQLQREPTRPSNEKKRSSLAPYPSNSRKTRPDRRFASNRRDQRSAVRPHLFKPRFARAHGCIDALTQPPSSDEQLLHQSPHSFRLWFVRRPDHSRRIDRNSKGRPGSKVILFPLPILVLSSSREKKKSLTLVLFVC